tara:strand:+ start:529 stop:732 length:204 start_codon:yes stop_codon:yes gene_type:complete
LTPEEKIREYFKKKGEAMEIKMPVYYIIGDNGEKHYDYEEMADELENRICKKLNVNVLITISEVEEE